MILSINYDRRQNKKFSDITDIIMKNVSKLELRRFSDKENVIEADKPNQISKLSADLKNFEETLTFDFIDNSNIF